MINHIQNKSFVYIMYVYCVYVLCIYKNKHMHVTYLRKIYTYLTFLLIRLKTNFLKWYRTGISFILLIEYEWIMNNVIIWQHQFSNPYGVCYTSRENIYIIKAEKVIKSFRIFFWKLVNTKKKKTCNIL